MTNTSLKSINLVILICSIGLAIWGCKEREDTANQEAVKEEIKSTLNAMWAAIENGDIRKYETYIHPDFTQFGEYDSALRAGKEAEIAGIKNWIDHSEGIHTEMISPIVTIRGKVAWITYYWQDHGITDGKKFSTRGKSTRVFVNENGRWLCIHGHYTLLGKTP